LCTVDERDDRNVEAITESHKSGCLCSKHTNKPKLRTGPTLSRNLCRGINIQDSSQLSWLEIDNNNSNKRDSVINQQNRETTCLIGHNAHRPALQSAKSNNDIASKVGHQLKEVLLLSINKHRN
jgi:hypothetical protein